MKANHFAGKLAALALVALMVLGSVPVQSADLSPVCSESRAVGGYPSLVNNTSISDATWLNCGRKAVRDDTGYLHAVFQNGTQVCYANSTDNGKTWSKPVSLNGTSLAGWNPVMACSGTTLYVAWMEDANIHHVMLKRSTDRGNTWSAATTIYEPNDYWGVNGEDVAIAASGVNVYVVWRVDNGGQWDDFLYFRRSTDSGANWFAYQQLTDTNWGTFLDDRYPSVAASGTNCFITYTRYLATGPETFFLRSVNQGQTFNAAPGTQLSATLTGQTLYPSLAADGNNLFVAFQDNAAGNWSIFFRSSADGGVNWIPAVANPATNISGANRTSQYPTVASNGTNATVMWEDNFDHATGDIFFSYYNGSAFQGIVDITNNQDTNARPNAFLNISNMKLEWLWTANGTPYGVYYDFYNFTPNNVPTLGWTGEVGYAADGLNPEGNTTGHVYTYRVDYTDSDNDTPAAGYPQVWVDRNRNGLFSVDERYSMTEVNSSDNVYTDGKRFSFSTQFTEIGTYCYTFKARDSKNGMATGAPTGIKTGPVIDAINFPPILAWTEEKGYENDGLDPETGGLKDNFTYRIKYTDVQNEAPMSGFPKVLFDMNNDGTFTGPTDESASMLEETSADTTYYNGKIYTYDRKFANLGVYGYMFMARDFVGLENQSAPKAGPNVTVITNIPLLSWAGSAGYSTDGVEPNGGSVTTNFTFRVRYEDADNEAPRNGYVELGVDLNLSGTIEPAEWMAMNPTDPLDVNYLDGKLFNLSMKLPVLGTYNYSFRAWDTPGASAIGAPTGVKAVLVNQVQRSPVLSWTGEQGFVAGGVSPGAGIANQTLFDYRIRYEDADGDVPVNGSPDVGIDLNLNGAIEPAEYFLMTEADPADPNVIDGKLFVYNRTFALAGSYSYIFRASDGIDQATGAPTYQMTGPLVSQGTVNNHPPVLAWTGAPGYQTDGADPDTGVTTTVFVFKVRYTDADNEAPALGYPRVLVDSNNDGVFDLTDTAIPMDGENPAETDYVVGKVYRCNSDFKKTGEFNYTVEAKSVNANEAAFLPGVLKGSVKITRSNTAPTLEWAEVGGFVGDGLDPNSGFTGAKFTYRVVFRDVDGDMSAAGYPKVIIDLNGDGVANASTESFAMNAVDAADANTGDGKAYEYLNVGFSKAGTFLYRFIAQDSLGASATPLEGTGPVISVQVINQPPVLRFLGEANYLYDAVNPQGGTKGTSFEFKILYFDSDNDKPVGERVTMTLERQVAGGSWESQEAYLSAANTADTNCTDGKLYSTKLTLSKTGEYRYTLKVTNEANQSVTLGPIGGPTVLVKTDAKQVQAGMPTFLWLLILILMVVVALVVGYAVGRKGSNPPPEDPYQAPGHRADAEKGEKWEELKDESARNDPQEGMEQPVREETPPPAPAEEPKPEETPAEEPKAHEKPAEELKPEEKPADEPKAEEKPAEEPRKDDTKSDLDDLIKKLGT